jgi:hypothetical protein
MKKIVASIQNTEAKFEITNKVVVEFEELTINYRFNEAHKRLHLLNQNVCIIVKTVIWLLEFL